MKGIKPSDVTASNTRSAVRALPSRACRRSSAFEREPVGAFSCGRRRCRDEGVHLGPELLLAADQAEEMLFSGDCGFTFMTGFGLGAYLRLDMLPLLGKSLGFPEELFHSPLRNRARVGFSRSLLEE